MDAHPDLDGSSHSYPTWETVDPEGRPPDIFDGTTTIHTGPDTPTHVLLAIVLGGARKLVAQHRSIRKGCAPVSNLKLRTRKGRRNEDA